MKQTQIFLLLSCLTIINSCEAYVQTKFKIIKSVNGTLVYEDVERTTDLEYPRSNSKILGKLKDLWENYYKCLELNENLDRKPEIRRLQQGLYTEFTCEICPRPFQNYEELEWKYKKLFPYGQDTDPLQNLVLTSEMVLTVNKTLKIYNAVEGLEGLYVCYRKDSVVSVYILEVSNNDTVEKETVETKNVHLVKTSENVFKTYYSWSEWTECNACGRVGKQFKYGTCYVTINQEGDLFEKAVEKQGLLKSTKDIHYIVTARGKSLKREILSSVKGNSVASKYKRNGIFGAQILEKFATGIPCASPYLPEEISEMIQNFKAVKVLMRYCREPCEKNEIFMALDSKGRIVEIANNSAGIYSMFQEFPQLLPEVERVTLSADFGKDLLIHCPGTSLTNTPAVWKIKNKIIFPEIIATDSKGRITIDLLNRVHIKKLRRGDSHTYSCWHKKTLVGTVHLIVEKKFSIGLNHHVILFLILIVFGSLILVGRKIIIRELQKQNK